MVKILNGTCGNNIVYTSDGLQVPNCLVLSEGMGTSTGIIIISDVGAVYIAKTSPDLESLLAPLENALTNIQLSLTLDDHGATSASYVTAAVAAIDAIKAGQL